MTHFGRSQVFFPMNRDAKCRVALGAHDRREPWEEPAGRWGKKDQIERRKGKVCLAFFFIHSFFFLGCAVRSGSEERFNDSCQSGESRVCRLVPLKNNALPPRVARRSRCQASRCAFEGGQTTDESLITQQENVCALVFKGAVRQIFCLQSQLRP